MAAVDAGDSTTHLLKADSVTLHMGTYHISRAELDTIWIVGAGKATASMAKAAEAFFLREFPNLYSGGLIVVKDGHGIDLELIRCMEAGHPLPDTRGEKAAIELLKFVSRTHPNDLILCLLSGGASALLPAPAKGITLNDKTALNRELLKCGANIHEINALRKHCSNIKGGRLILAAEKARWITLAISDVPGDSPESIGSGPTVGDSTTLKDCWDIMKKYDLERKMPAPILHHLRKNTSETPEPDDPAFSRTHYEIVAKNSDAVKAAKDKARDLNYRVIEEEKFLSEDVSDVVNFWAEMRQRYDEDSQKPYVAICGGEPTVEVKGSGKGGRNLELALRLSTILPGEFTFLSAGTDGTDGPTNAAGAFVDQTTRLRARKAGLDIDGYLERNDSYTFFERLGDLFATGPTGTNVMDLQMLIVWE